MSAHMICLCCTLLSVTAIIEITGLPAAVETEEEETEEESEEELTGVKGEHPCNPTPCGKGANCKNDGGTALCTCPPGTYGDPFVLCNTGECKDDNDCPHEKSCQRAHCVDPCVGVCGENAECMMKKHIPICQCPKGFIGDAFVACRISQGNELCEPSPCGKNTKCKVKTGVPTCSCLPGFRGSAIKGCRRECETNADCPKGKQCANFKCTNPCTSSCGEGAHCFQQGVGIVCSCPPGYIGNPYNKCFVECRQHSQCSDDKACNGSSCIDPCFACGVGAKCFVRDHRAHCTCPQGMAGNPLVSCEVNQTGTRPNVGASKNQSTIPKKEDSKVADKNMCVSNPCGNNTQCTINPKNVPLCTCLPGFVGEPSMGCIQTECQSDEVCGELRVCIHGKCVDPCEKTCGLNAKCTVRHRLPVCSCPRGFKGDPLEKCVHRKKKNKSEEETVT